MRAVAAVSILDHPRILFRASRAARTNEHSEKEGKKEEMNEPRQVADILMPGLSLVLGGTGQGSPVWAFQLWVRRESAVCMVH